MGVKKGLDALSALNDEQNRDYSDSPKAVWMKINPGKSAKFRFLQELDKSSKHYSEKNGLVLVAQEHSSPSDFKRKALCTMEDEERCYACEQNRANPKTGWARKNRLYANVLVETDEGEEVQIMSQGIGNKGIFPVVLDHAKEDDSITNRPFKITRNGEGQQTGYSIRGYDKDDSLVKDVEKYDVFDLEKVCTRDVPYEDQAEFYNGGAAATDSAPSSGGSEGGGGWPSSGGGDLSGW